MPPPQDGAVRRTAGSCGGCYLHVRYAKKAESFLITYSQAVIDAVLFLWGPHPRAQPLPILCSPDPTSIQSKLIPLVREDGRL